MDVFISYSRKYRDSICPLVEELRALHLDVWLDIEVNPGELFSEKIEANLTLAKCVLVLWTKDAVSKGPQGWVRSEADWALQHKKLIQAQLEPVKLPPPFYSSEVRPIDLSSMLRGDRSLADGTWNSLLQPIGRFVRRPGLAELRSASRTEASFLAWAARYKNDPVSTAEGAGSELATRLQRVRLNETARIRRSGNLAVELRSLVDEVERAPYSSFSHAPMTEMERQLERHGSTSSLAEKYRERFRQDVAELWPRSASAFAALGLDANVYGLEFYGLAVERDFDGATPILLVSGEVRNIGRDDKLVPPVRISLRDATSTPIFEIINVVTDQPVARGASIPFQIRVENPPVGAIDLQATFAAFSEAQLAGAAPRVSPTALVEEPLTLDQPVGDELIIDEPITSSEAASVEGLALRLLQT